MTLLHGILSGIALLSVAVIYGTDVFSALVQRPAMARVDDEVLTATMGFIHLYGDKRLSVPGVIGVVATALTTGAAAFTGNTVALVAGAVALVLLIVWLVIYGRISAPVNKKLTAAAVAGVTATGARQLQLTWDSVINVRVLLQGLALCALFLGAAIR
ncbi:MULTISPECIES: DUF1772 domain-containing protein [Streptomyces]|uniref:DUF1772 domain-containing protein n=1 Tax=Streptomyces eurythermus TaxID=42237 RepID=A0ABW6Z526_9ACTN|nr:MULTISPECIES: DUF1772 domain-containing protein [Streptomyces]QIS74056.1 DUF1772 domain-containing protein [Streptomyces sp. DSM 40868]WDM16586.1 DUF1772 domain-containing protein [Streptomyces lavenduligriseus]